MQGVSLHGAVAVDPEALHVERRLPFPFPNHRLLWPLLLLVACAHGQTTATPLHGIVRDIAGSTNPEGAGGHAIHVSQQPV
jgi:hypothetical protein